MSPLATIDLSHTALLLIDIQIGFSHPTYWGNSRSNPSFDDNITALLAAFRAVLPPSNIIHVYHSSLSPTSPLHPSSPGISFMPFAKPHDGEPVLKKSVNSCFIGTPLEEMLKEKQRKTIFVVGLTTDHCVSTTIRMAANLGVTGDGGRVILVDDGTATTEKGGWDAKVVHDVHVASLKGEFCEVVRTEDVRGWLNAEEKE